MLIVLEPLSVAMTVKRTDRVPFTRLDHELLAIDAQAGHLYSLNATGGRIWDALTGPMTIGELVDRLIATFDVDRATCERDVLALLGRLRDAGFVAVVR